MVPERGDRDERLTLAPDEALRALLGIGPHTEPAEDDEREEAPED